MIGEIGGGAEERGADFIEQKMNKPVAAFIAGTTACRPPGQAHGARGGDHLGRSGYGGGEDRGARGGGREGRPDPSDMASTLKAMMSKN